MQPEKALPHPDVVAPAGAVFWMTWIYDAYTSAVDAFRAAGLDEATAVDAATKLTPLEPVAWFPALAVPSVGTEPRFPAIPAENGPDLGCVITAPRGRFLLAVALHTLTTRDEQQALEAVAEQHAAGEYRWLALWHEGPAAAGLLN